MTEPLERAIKFLNSLYLEKEFDIDIVITAHELHEFGYDEPLHYRHTISPNVVLSWLHGKEDIVPSYMVIINEMYRQENEK